MDHEFFHSLYTDLNGVRVFFMRKNEGWGDNMDHPMLDEIESIMERVASIEREMHVRTR